MGCGLGGLDWKVVRPLIEKAFSEVPDVSVALFEPAGTPDAKTMPVRTGRPKMMVARALFVKLMEHYISPAYRLTLLEIQKLAYFLQEAGEPLKLKFEAGHYGPYAPNLNKVLEIMEGHFIRGYGDSQKPDVDIELMQGAIEEADRFLEAHQDSYRRLKKIDDVIDGFETPYGMELLSSVHWVTVHGDPLASDADAAIQRIHQWNARKQKCFNRRIYEPHGNV